MRLGVVTAAIGHLAPEGLWAYAAFGRLMDALRDRVDDFHIAMSQAPHRLESHDHRLAVPFDKVVPLPHMPSMQHGIFQHSQVVRAIRAVERVSDVLFIQLPFAPPTALFSVHRPRVFQLTADLVRVVSASKFYRGPRRVLAVGAAQGVHALQYLACHRARSRVVANGQELLERYGNPAGAALVSSSLLASEIGSISRSRSVDDPFRILFVGFLRPEKGIDVLLDAYERLLDVVPGAELKIVGARDSVEGGAARELTLAVEKAGRRGSVEFLGYRAFGPDLFRCYADADVLALPSRSEGTPRVLVEARAFGCAVVGTRVGGIPTSIEHGVDGLLVPPESSEALADALVKLATDLHLRARLQAGGLARARRTTVEAMADRIVGELTAALES